MIETIKNIARQITSRAADRNPQIAIILGSGLGNIAEQITDQIVINYSDIEGFPRINITGHAGKLIIGRLKGVEVLCMQGRIHLYEGHAPQSINTVIKAFKLLGVKHLIVTNAAGSLDLNMPAGSIMLTSDHINMSGQNPLIGFNDENLGPRFPDLSNAYDKDIRQQIKRIAAEQKIKLYEGVYLMVLGPNFETAAEIKAFKILGANAVGMSTVPEVISAVHSGMKVLGLSAITNFGTGMQERPQSHDETLTQGERAAENMIKLLTAYLKEYTHG